MYNYNLNLMREMSARRRLGQWNEMKSKLTKEKKICNKKKTENIMCHVCIYVFETFYSILFRVIHSFILSFFLSMCACVYSTWMFLTPPQIYTPNNNQKKTVILYIHNSSIKYSIHIYFWCSFIMLTKLSQINRNIKISKINAIDSNRSHRTKSELWARK